MMVSPLRETVTMALGAGAGQPLTGFTRSHALTANSISRTLLTRDGNKTGPRISVAFVAARYPPHWSQAHGHYRGGSTTQLFHTGSNNVFSFTPSVGSHAIL